MESSTPQRKVDVDAILRKPFNAIPSTPPGCGILAWTIRERASGWRPVPCFRDTRSETRRHREARSTRVRAGRSLQAFSRNGSSNTVLQGTVLKDTVLQDTVPEPNGPADSPRNGSVALPNHCGAESLQRRITVVPSCSRNSSRFAPRDGSTTTEFRRPGPRLRSAPIRGLTLRIALGARARTTGIITTKIVPVGTRSAIRFSNFLVPREKGRRRPWVAIQSRCPHRVKRLFRRFPRRVRMPRRTRPRAQRSVGLGSSRSFAGSSTTQRTRVRRCV
jgi:hypothetical protein